MYLFVLFYFNDTGGYPFNYNCSIYLKKNFSCYGHFSKACGYAPWANVQSGIRPLQESTEPMDQWNDED